MALGASYIRVSLYSDWGVICTIADKLQSDNSPHSLTSMCAVSDIVSAIAMVHSTKAQAYCLYQWTEKEGTGSIFLSLLFFKYLLYFIYINPKTHWSLPQMPLGTARH